MFPLRVAYAGKDTLMKHLIADKLNFLMKATATRNNMLSRALAFDASHISRIRNGERGLPSHREFILPGAIDPVSGRPLSPTYSIVSSPVGVLLFSTQSPSVMFYTRELFMISSFGEYLNRMIKDAPAPKESMDRLQQYIDKLKSAMEKKNDK